MGRLEDWAMLAIGVGGFIALVWLAVRVVLPLVLLCKS